MAETTEFEHLFASGETFSRVFDFIDGKDWREFLAGERLSNTDLIAIGSDDLGALRDGEASILGNVDSGHTGDGGVELSIGFFATALGNAEHIFLEHALFFFGSEVDAVFLEEVDDGLINGGIDEDRGFGSADHAVIERFGEDNVVDALFEVSGFVDVAWDVTRADTEGWFAGGISSFDHAWATSGKDGSNAWVLH